MAKIILTVTVITALLITSCREAPRQENAEKATTESVEIGGDYIVKISSADKEGNELKLTFNNSKGIATLDFNGESIELVAQKSASGIWYKNDQYELRGKGDNVELTKEGKIVFKN